MSSVTVLDTVSPVPKATVMMTVASMRPKMMRVVWARRRGMLRRPVLNMTGLRKATHASSRAMTTVIATTITAIVFMETPNSSSMIGRYACAPARARVASSRSMTPSAM